MLSRIVAVALLIGSSEAFTIMTNNQRTASSTTVLQMGLFDGVREAFSAPTLEQSTIDKERETPIDRWMGWSVTSDREQQQQQQQITADSNFVDSMDEKNYVIVNLPKPMGIVFEENDADHGGIFVQSIKEDGVAAKVGGIQEGDQLVGVNNKKVSGLTFDDALGAIVESTSEQTKLTFFRGSAKQLYGPTGASQKWLDEFIGVETTPAKTTEESTSVA